MEGDLHRQTGELSALFLGCRLPCVRESFDREGEVVDLDLD